MCQTPKNWSFLRVSPSRHRPLQVKKNVAKQQKQKANEALLVFKDNNRQYKRSSREHIIIMFLYMTGKADCLTESGFLKPN